MIRWVIGSWQRYRCSTIAMFITALMFIGAVVGFGVYNPKYLAYGLMATLFSTLAVLVLWMIWHMCNTVAKKQRDKIGRARGRGNR